MVAVVVCVKKWYDARLWTQVQDLGFNQDLVFEENHINQNTFCDFVDRMISFVVLIRGFKMFAYYDIEPNLTTRWILDAVRLGAVEIHLDCSKFTLIV